MKLKKSFPLLGQVYPVLGNHEGFPCDQFDLKGDKHQWILDNASDLWRQWFTEESYISFRKYGRYSQLHPGTKLRIMTVNTFLYGVLNSYLWSDSTDPHHDLEWIEITLKNAEINNESVIIIGHIPPTMTDSEISISITLDWQKRYHSIIERYTNIIRAQMFGHTHQDNIQVMRGAKNKDQIIGLVYILPQLGIFRSSNPSYRIFDVQTDNYAISNYHQYRLYINEANKAGTPKWRVAYIFKLFYNVSSMEYSNVAKAIESFRTDPEFTKKAIEQMFQEGPDGTKWADKKSMHMSRHFELYVLHVH